MKLSNKLKIETFTGPGIQTAFSLSFEIQTTITEAMSEINPLVSLLRIDPSRISCISDPVIATIKLGEEPNWTAVLERLETFPEETHYHNEHGVPAIGLALCCAPVPAAIIDKMAEIAPHTVTPDAVLKAIQDENIDVEILQILLCTRFHSDPPNQFSPDEIDAYLEACEPALPRDSLQVEKMKLIIDCDPFVLSRVDDNGMIPIQRACIPGSPWHIAHVTYRSMLIVLAIDHAIHPGYDGAGGLFETNLGTACAMDLLIEDVRQSLYNDSFRESMDVLQCCCLAANRELYGDNDPSFLHASIGLVPCFFMKNLMGFHKNDFAKRDSFGNTLLLKAILVATTQRNQYKYQDWEGLFEILLDPVSGGGNQLASLLTSDCLALHTAAEKGLKWEEGMRLVLEANRNAVNRKEQKISGLYPFMLAAAGETSDLTSIFHLILENPLLCTAKEDEASDDDYCIERVCKRARTLSIS